MRIKCDNYCIHLLHTTKLGYEKEIVRPENCNNSSVDFFSKYLHYLHIIIIIYVLLLAFISILNFFIINAFYQWVLHDCGLV